MRSKLAHRVAALGMLVALVAGTAGLVTLHDPGPTSAAVEVAPLDLTPAAPLPAPPPAPVAIPAPTRLQVPAIGVDEGLTGRGLKTDGSLDTPGFGKAAWYRPGPRPGEPGGAVIVAHVHGPDGPDVFWDLARLRPGDLVHITHPDAVLTFVVTSVQDVPKDDLPYERIWPATREPLLRLITCGGKRLPQGGYPDNTVVFARLATD